jgi:hypothetical protein
LPRPNAPPTKRCHCRALAAARLEDGFNLPEVIDIVTGVVHRDVTKRLHTTLGMNTVHVPLFGAQQPEKSEIRLPQDLEEYERIADVA